MPAVRVQITRYTNDSNPGWVECRLTDAWGTEWLFEEKVPVVAAEELDDQTPYPQPGLFACQLIKEWQDENNRTLFTINTEKPWGIQPMEGTTKFDVLTSQLMDWG